MTWGDQSPSESTPLSNYNLSAKTPLIVNPNVFFDKNFYASSSNNIEFLPKLKRNSIIIKPPPGFNNSNNLSIVSENDENTINTSVSDLDKSITNTNIENNKDKSKVN